MSGRILIVDDDQSLCELFAAALGRMGFNVVWKTAGEDAFAALKSGDFDVLLADLRLPGMTGLELCERTVANRADVPVIVMTAFGSLDTAIAAIRAGAYDFVTKPVDVDILAISLRRAMKHRALQEEVKVLSQTLKLFGP